VTAHLIIDDVLELAEYPPDLRADLTLDSRSNRVMSSAEALNRISDDLARYAGWLREIVTRGDELEAMVPEGFESRGFTIHLTDKGSRAQVTVRAVEVVPE
jgi:hypothetical protein